MNFKEWLRQQEDVNLGGVEPPQEPVASIAALGAMPRYSMDDDEKPPTENHPRMSKKMKKMKKK